MRWGAGDVNGLNRWSPAAVARLTVWQPVAGLAIHLVGASLSVELGGRPEGETLHAAGIAAEHRPYRHQRP